MNSKTEKKSLTPEPLPELSYSIQRFESGYSVFEHKLIGKLTTTERISEPNVFVICMNNLSAIIRKNLGL